MKVLIVHNNYGAVSGEEVMLKRIIDLLTANGNEVEVFIKDSSKIFDMKMGSVRAFFSGIYSLNSRREIRRLIQEFKPDIVQIQNLFPLISPAVLPVIKSEGIPILMRVSNYRLVCPNGLLLSHGAICEKCRGGKEYWCLLKNCENNVLKSLGYALRNWSARFMKYYINHVDHYYAQTVFQKSILDGDGIVSEKVSVIPNMVKENESGIDTESGYYIASAGRVSPEKGAKTFAAAARLCERISFKVAGDCSRMPELVKSSSDNLSYLGHLGGNSLDLFYRKCRIFVMPSLWYEGFPSVLIEAMLSGKPVICSRIGGLPEIVEDGVTGILFEPGNAEELACKVKYLYSRPDLCKEMGSAGRRKVLEEYSEQKYYERLVKVYEKVLKL